MAECIDHPLRVDHVRRRRLSSSGSATDEYEDEALDPRIQVELEKLNKSSEEINKLELELDDARAGFRQALSDSTQKLNALAKKLGACVEKARPYYEARVKCKEAHQETQKAAIRFERACSMHEAAKEMVQLAEQGYMKREHSTDPAWQEMLNHATMKVNEAEKERNESEMEHQRTTKNFQDADKLVQTLQKELKRAITKSKPYFEMKAKFNHVMEEDKRRVGVLEEDVSSTKSLYAQALRNLEAISDEIHQQRLERQKKRQLGKRGSGVGAESPSPPPTWDKGGGRVEGRDMPQASTDSLVRPPPDVKTSPLEKSPKSASEVPSASTLPSVIHSSPGDSRRESYRRAVSHGTSEAVSPDSFCSADYNEDYDVPSLEEEFMSLPPTQSSQEPVRSWVRHPLESPNSDDVVCCQDLEPTGEEEEAFQSVELRRKESRERSSSQPSDLVTSHSSSPPHPNRQRSLSGTDTQAPSRPFSSGSTVSESSPAGSSPSNVRKSKLQGLILRVDPTMDPLQQVFNARSIQQKTTARPSQYYTTSAGVAPQAPAPPHSTEEALSSSGPKVKASPGGRRGIRRTGSGLSEEDQTLRVPGAGSSVPSEGVEDSSDTESIASTGPMLDDDQVELLTLDFSKEPAICDDIPPPSFRRQNWSRMSLPPRLSYLEGYVKRKSREFEGQNASIREHLSEEAQSPEEPPDHALEAQQT